VLLPSSVPYVLSGLRVAAGRGPALGAELFGAQDGLGLLISMPLPSSTRPACTSASCSSPSPGVAVTKVFFVLERKVAPWRELQT